MSAVATADQATLDAELEAPPVFESGGTLEDRVLGAWEALVLEGRATCLVCRGEVTAGAPCSSCGSELS